MEPVTTTTPSNKIYGISNGLAVWCSWKVRCRHNPNIDGDDFDDSYTITGDPGVSSHHAHRSSTLVQIQIKAL